MRDSIDLVIPAYNAAAVIADTLSTIADQHIPGGWTLNVYVSDDGSGDHTCDRVRELAASYDFLHLVSADTNGGRSVACNRGVAAGSGSVIVICDADCRYTRPDALAEFVREIEAGNDLVIGLIELAGRNFWASYTNRVTADRQRLRERMGLMAFSTQNVAVRRSLYGQLGGYSTDYFKYGFEDKDFLLRAEKAGARVVVRDDIRVSHDDDFDLDAVLRKAEESGRYSASVFRTKFPHHYRKLAYARCDSETAGIVRWLKAFSGPLASITAVFARGLIRLAFLGIAARILAVRMAVCAAYFHGTRLANDESAALKNQRSDRTERGEHTPN